jgi:hypothetical protein
MTMVKRNEVNKAMIAAAKVMPDAKADEDTDSKRSTDSDLSKAAEAPVKPLGGAPARLPGYGK